MIAHYFTLFEKIRGTLDLLVFSSLERKDDPCKSDSSTFYLFEKMLETLPMLVLNLLEGKDDPCKSDYLTFSIFKKMRAPYRL